LNDKTPVTNDKFHLMVDKETGKLDRFILTLHHTLSSPMGKQLLPHKKKAISVTK